MAKKTILVVEDEENIRELICLNLQKSGFEVLEAGTGERALEVFAERGAVSYTHLDVYKRQVPTRVAGYWVPSERVTVILEAPLMTWLLVAM